MALRMTSYEMGAVILAWPLGAREIKPRPGVIISSSLYHSRRSDVIVGILTSQLHEATTPFDHLLLDWREAGLLRPTLFRAFIVTVPAGEIIRQIGHLSDRDWRAARACVRRVLAPMEDTPE